MPGVQCDHDSVVPATRLERLLRNRELRKSSRSLHSNEGVRDGCVPDSEKRPQKENFLEGIAASKTPGDVKERRDGCPQKQRLLVVANRLPVAATRQGKESWTLEVSVGGLVSALLGKKITLSFFSLVKLLWKYPPYLL